MFCTALAAAFSIFVSSRSFFAFDKTLDFFDTLCSTGSFLAIKVAISLFTLATPDCCCEGGSVGIIIGGVACRRSFRDRGAFAIQLAQELGG